MKIANIASYVIIQCAIVATVLGETSVQDDGEKKRLVLFRLFPALATVMIFIGGVIAVSVRYWMKMNEQKDSAGRALEDKETASSWLERLRQTQGDGGAGALGRRRTTLFGKKFLANNKMIRMKKYALYEDMLAKYKHRLRMQKIHSMRSMAKTLSESVDKEAGEDTGGGKIERNKRAGSGRMRMRDLALRHRLTHEQQENWQIEAMMQNQMEPSFWMSQATQELSKPAENESVREKKLSKGSSFETQGTLKQINIDIETEKEGEKGKTQQTETREANLCEDLSKHEVRRKISPGLRYQMEVEEVKLSLDHTDDEKNIISAQVLHDCETNEHENEANLAPLLPDKKKSEEEIRLRPKVDRRRPRSMFGSLNSKKFSYLPDDNDDGRKKDKEKRKSWIQGLFNGKEEKKKKEKRLSMNDIDNIIDDQMERALLNYMTHLQTETFSETLNTDECNVAMATENSTLLDTHDESSDISSHLPNVRIQHRPKRPVTWFACSDENAHSRERKLSHGRPKSLSLIEKLKERFRAAESSYFDEKTITELFAGLMDLQPERSGSHHTISQAPSTSLPTLAEVHGSDVHLTSSHVDQVLQEVERRMIQHLNERDELESNEVEALEKLLDDITKFSMEYSVDFEDVEDRRQLTFLQANNELMEVETRGASCSPVEEREYNQSAYQTEIEMTTNNSSEGKRNSKYDDTSTGQITQV